MRAKDNIRRIVNGLSILESDDRTIIPNGVLEPRRNSYYIIWHPEVIKVMGRFVALISTRFGSLSEICEFINSPKCLNVMRTNSSNSKGVVHIRGELNPHYHLCVIKTNNNAQIVKLIQIDEFCSIENDEDDDNLPKRPTQPQSPITPIPRQPESPIPFEPDPNEDEDEEEIPHVV